MDALDAIFSRKSVRKYSGRRISNQDLHTILLAGMSGPSCVNARDRSFFISLFYEFLPVFSRGSSCVLSEYL